MIRTIKLLSLAVMISAFGFSQAAFAKNLTIGFSEVTQQSPFYVELKEGVQAAVNKTGNKLLFVDAQGSLVQQNNDIQDLLTRGINVLLINPVNPQGVAPSLAAAHTNNVPVISVDRNVSGETASYVGRKNVKMAKLSANALIDALKKAGVTSGPIIEIKGAAGGIVTQERHKGFMKAFEDAGYKIVEGPNCGYIRKKAIAAMQDLLQAHPDVVAVFAHNDDMAMGALQVLHQSGYDDVLVAGVDGLTEALKAIKNGDQYVATAMNDPHYLGKLAVHTAIKIANGVDVPSFVNAGTKLVTDKNIANVEIHGAFGDYVPEAKE